MFFNILVRYCSSVYVCQIWFRSQAITVLVVIVMRIEFGRSGKHWGGRSAKETGIAQQYYGPGDKSGTV